VENTVQNAQCVSHFPKNVLLNCAARLCDIIERNVLSSFDYLDEGFRFMPKLKVSKNSSGACTKLSVGWLAGFRNHIYTLYNGDSVTVRTV
jgi:hypothetical protein